MERQVATTVFVSVIQKANQDLKLEEPVNTNLFEQSVKTNHLDKEGDPFYSSDSSCPLFCQLCQLGPSPWFCRAAWWGGWGWCRGWSGCCPPHQPAVINSCNAHSDCYTNLFFKNRIVSICIFIVEVPAPVHHDHPQGGGQEHNDEDAGLVVAAIEQAQHGQQE